MPRHPHRALSVVALVLSSILARPGGSQPLDGGAAPAERSTRTAKPTLDVPEDPSAPRSTLGALGPRKFDPGRAREQVEKLAADVRRAGGRVGVLALDVASGATLAAVDERGLYNPASNAKLFTAAAALRLLGPGYRYLTGLYGDASNGSVAELVLRGSGDPSLRTRDLWEMARDLRAAGVRKVAAIAIDQGYFDARFVPPAFEQQPDEWAAFRAPVAAASLNANALLFTVRPSKAGQPASVAIDPPGFVVLRGAVTTAKRDTPERIGVRLEPSGQRLVAHLSGHVPEGGRAVSVARRVDDPRLLVAYTLKEMLQEVGVEVSGEVRLGGERQKRLLVAHRSAPLGELLAALGKDSDNFYAETIFKTLAAEKRGRPGTAEAAATLVGETLGELDAFTEGVVLRNGSGLFDAARASPEAIVRLLRAAFLDPALGADFTAQLAIGGVDGTLRGRFRGWSKERAIRAKTGTLASVVALSGYILPPPGRSPIAFAVLVAEVPGKIDPVRRVIDDFVGALADELWRDARAP
ncbi:MULTISPECIES: D-alanyl-D-alanine carboxypeptidase/D-alanyl-D-alanine-endopeptidase [Sorangium]|uniref:D-alanyl-D-alanine carboxypeptidase n=1 Tax=Sorangium cellulosum TaxID=56 RepID=A0A4P2R0S8_SORCE|nr:MULTISPECIES: D-alanyl-D-alanine carboxypeptidase/D-alanyl-D-alanine-endopeptidase [Sorangium]AUX36520.1 D-alanyl-D-alanine carboxypeptidase [Sorangium cellulosum]WCQ95818.1 D-alanyl-D-alanine carboxypeptidase [Sorangium sp. Soce836]